MTEQQPIELIAIDLDGTLLDTKHQLSERNENALKAAIDQGVKVVIATGKTRQSAVDIIQRLQLNTPGIFLQGLMIYQADGAISHQQEIDPETARQIVTFAEERGYSMVIYSGSRLLTRQLSDRIHALTTHYHEPEPEAIGPLQNIIGEMPVNKLIAVRDNDPKRITALRWLLERQLDGKGRLVQSMLPDMLEILPPGVSKGKALKIVLKQLGIPAERVLAIGDAENDLEMIQTAGISVAVGNAQDLIKEAADHVVASNDDDGVAEAIERFVLHKQPEVAAEESAESTAPKESSQEKDA